MEIILAFIAYIAQLLGAFSVFILVIALLVFIHELGHFLAAKLLKVKVNEFALGFGKALWQKKYKGTLYRLNLIPLGGYVSLEGEEREHEQSPDLESSSSGNVSGSSKTTSATGVSDVQDGNFQDKPWWVKATILLAGVFMNFVLAVVLLAGYLAVNNYQNNLIHRVDYDFIGAESVKVTSGVIVGSVQEGFPAEGKLQQGDAILRLNNSEIASQEDFLSKLDQNQGDTITLTILDSQDYSESTEVIIDLGQKQEEDEPLLGVGFSFVPEFIYTIEYPQNILSGFSHSVNVFGYQVAVLAERVQASVEQGDANVVGREVRSIVAVGAVVGQQVSIFNIDEIVNLAAIVSLSLALFNLLPLPLLDGGQLTLYTIEAVTRRKIDERVINILNQGTFLFLIILSLYLILRDVLEFQLLQGLIDQIRGIANS